MPDAYGNLANSFNDMTRNLLQLKGQSMQNALSEAELAMRGNQFMEGKRQFNIQNFGTETPEPGAQTLHQRQISNAEEANRLHRATLPIGQTDFSPVKYSQIMANLKNKTGLSSSIDTLGKTKLWQYATDPNARIDTVYDNIASMDKGEINEFLTNIANEYESKVQKDPNFAKTRQGKAAEQMMDFLYNAQTGTDIAAGFMPEVHRARQIQEENSKAALANAKAVMANPETQYIINKTAQYVKSGMSPEDATVKAFEDLSVIKARQAREGRVNVSLNAASGGQVDTLAKGILDGTINPDAISKRGGLQAAVWARVKEINPEFNIVAAGAGAKFQQSNNTMQTKALLNSIDPLLQQLDQAGGILGNSSVPIYNKARNFLKEQTGSDDIVGFNNLRDDVIAEVERGLLGTGVLSDSKYMRALKNVNSAQSYPQLQAAIKNMRTVIHARLEALHAGPNAQPPGKTETPQRRSTDPKKIGRFTVEVE